MIRRKLTGLGIVWKHIPTIRALASKRAVCLLLLSLFTTSIFVFPASQVLAAPTPAPAPTPTANTTSDNQQEQNSGNQEIYNKCKAAHVGPLEWLLCAVLSLFTNTMQWGESLIVSFLDIDTNSIFYDNGKPNSSGKAFHKAWNYLRIISLSLIVVAALVMIIAQASGIELLSAYTIRKILPRFLFAAIFITLSWSALELLVTLSNDAGHGILQLFKYAFKDVASGSAEITAVANGVGATAILFLIGAALFEVIGLLSFAVTALLGIFVAIGVLILRELLLMLLVIFAPLAIACYILPNTHRIWTIWKDMLIAVLLVYPIVAGMIAIGHAFAMIAIARAGDPAPGDPPAGSMIYSIIAMISYIAPYFMMATAFRLAGGIMGTLTGMVNDPNRGVFDRLSNFRKGKIDYNTNRLRWGNRYSNRNPLGKAFNTASKVAMNAPNAPLGMNPLRWGSRYSTFMSTSDYGKALSDADKDPYYNAVKADDTLLDVGRQSVLTGRSVRSIMTDIGKSKNWSSAEINTKTAAVEQAMKSMGDRQFLLASTVGLAGTGTGYHTEQGGSGAMLKAISDASGGDYLLGTRMMFDAGALANKAGRIDLGGASAGTRIGTLREVMFNNMSEKDATAAFDKSVLFSNNGASLIGAKDFVLKKYSEQMLNDLGNTKFAYDDKGAVIKDERGEPKLNPQYEQDYARKLADIAAMYDAASHASPQNARVIATEILGKKVTDDFGLKRIETVSPEIKRDEDKTVQRLIESFRGDPRFTEMRREFYSRYVPPEVLQQQGQQPQG